MVQKGHQWQEFQRSLETLGWSRAELARRLGLHPNSVSKWGSPPEYALAYLRLAVGQVEQATALRRSGPKR